MTIGSAQRSTADWEQSLGDQLRRLRLAAALDQAQLADLAAVSIGAVRNLERGNGSTLRTLVHVLRALDREDWLGTLAPSVSVSPLEVYRSGRRDRTRVYRPRGGTPERA